MISEKNLKENDCKEIFLNILESEKQNGLDEEILVKELTDWQTEAHKSKEDFDNFPEKFELLKVFEII